MASRDAARRGCALLREMLSRGLLGTGPETLMDLVDLCEYVEGNAVNDDNLTPDEAQMLRDANDSREIIGDAVREKLAGHVKTLLAKHVRLQQAVWPGLPKFEPTAERPQQDFFEAVAESFRTENAKLQRFKDWVHAYLDAHGVPHHPPGVHGAEGCRIGDRMDWLMAKVAGLEAENARMKQLIASYGSNPAGFDWGVLGQIDQLERDLAAAREMLTRHAENAAITKDAA